MRCTCHVAALTLTFAACAACAGDASTTAPYPPPGAALVPYAPTRYVDLTQGDGVQPAEIPDTVSRAMPQAATAPNGIGEKKPR